MKNEEFKDSFISEPAFYKQMGVFHAIFDVSLVDYIKPGT